MGLEYVRDPGTGAVVEAAERLYLTEDDRLVPDGDPAGRWLYCVPGRQIPRGEAEKYGLLDEPKHRQESPNKQKRTSGTKGKG